MDKPDRGPEAFCSLLQTFWGPLTSRKSNKKIPSCERAPVLPGSATHFDARC